MRSPTASILLVLLCACPALLAQAAHPGLNHNWPLVDAHNCYPYGGQWKDRIDRALAIGYPVGIEQDLAWGVDPVSGKGRAVVSHSARTSGSEPTLRDHFFEYVRPLMERALRENKRAEWPLITVHFDFKDNRPELHRAVWELLGEYEAWITTAPKLADPAIVAELRTGPLLVLTEDNDAQEQVFFKDPPVGARLRLFGSAHTASVPAQSREERMRLAATVAPEKLLSERPSNYRRWWNNSWFVVEEGGATKAGEWTGDDDARLRALVAHAHRLGFWIRFYTLDGFTAAENRGWDNGYNFGSREAVAARWKAAVAAGVDLIATDQIEDLATIVNQRGAN